MKHFTPVFYISVVLYALNRSYLHIARATPFLRFHFNDLFTIPVMFPLLVVMQKIAGARAIDDDPGALEVMLWCAAWSLLFEGIFPIVAPRWATGDPVDALCYFIGAIVYIAIDMKYRFTPPSGAIQI